jgi:hypothetical protein
VLDLVDEALDQVALAIEVLIIFALLKAANSWRDDRLDARGDERLNEVRRVVTLVADDYRTG